LPEKRKYDAYHVLGINNVIADVAQVVKPDLNIVDAVEKVVVEGRLTGCRHSRMQVCRFNPNRD